MTKNFWQNEIYAEYQMVKKNFYAHNYECTTSQDWVNYIDGISEILAYNNKTKEFKNIVMEDDLVLIMTNETLIKTRWSKIYYADGRLIGNATDEIFLIKKKSLEKKYFAWNKWLDLEQILLGSVLTKLEL